MDAAGDTSNHWVRYHNKIADWVAKAIKLAHKMHVYVVIEQPLTSLLFRYKPVFLALQKVGAQKISLQLGDFGAASAKPTALYGAARGSRH